MGREDKTVPRKRTRSNSANSLSGHRSSSPRKRYRDDRSKTDEIRARRKTRSPRDDDHESENGRTSRHHKKYPKEEEEEEYSRKHRHRRRRQQHSRSSSDERRRHESGDDRAKRRSNKDDSRNYTLKRDSSSSRRHRHNNNNDDDDHDHDSSSNNHRRREEDSSSSRVVLSDDQRRRRSPKYEDFPATYRHHNNHREQPLKPSERRSTRKHGGSSNIGNSDQRRDRKRKRISPNQDKKEGKMPPSSYEPLSGEKKRIARLTKIRELMELKKLKNEINPIDAPPTVEDPLDEFMTTIEDQCSQLQFIPKRVRRKRKVGGKMQSIVESVNSQAISISLEEIMLFQTQDAESNCRKQQLPESPPDSPDNEPLDAQIERPPTLPDVSSAAVPTGDSTQTESAVGLPSGVPSASEATSAGADSSIPPGEAAVAAPSVPHNTVVAASSTSSSSSAVPSDDHSGGGTNKKIARNSTNEKDNLADDLYLQAFMKKVKAQQIERDEEMRQLANKVRAVMVAEPVVENKVKGEQMEDEPDYRYGVEDEEGAGEGYFELLNKCGNKKDLPPVDHSKIEYPPFRKNLYIQVKELSLLSSTEVDTIRKLNGGIRVRGKMCPKPVLTFYQCGLPDVIFKLLERREYEKPFPIQMQCLPALMVGRDLIGIAETGSGKTLAYILPMIRQILDQPPLRAGEGPKGIVLAPTRELAVQIQREAHKLTKVVNLKSIAVYGGSGLGEQLSAIKRGADLIVGTPGRMIDVLTINSGKILSLKHVTFCILDEADRMFDLGFEPQITSILRNIRPDAQLAMFSATFPPYIETLAKKLLKKPLEVVVGIRGQTNSQIEQNVEVLSTPREKFLRLLQLLGEWAEYGSIIIFVSRQTEADELFAELLRVGYSSLVLHGGHEQVDRDFTVHDFKEGVSNILIATSVASRGLDVKSVVLVINYSAPDHLEDYVHRIGRTARAGNIGVAYTLLTPEDADKADDLIKALRQNNNDVPDNLQNLADSHRVQCSMGLAKQRGRSGFSGRGFKFTNNEMSKQQKEQARMKAELGIEDAEGEREEGDSTFYEDAQGSLDPASALAGAAAVVAAAGLPTSSNYKTQSSLVSLRDRPRAAAAAVSYVDPHTGNTVEEFDINDYPQSARFKLTHRDVLGRIAELTGAFLQIKGRYIGQDDPNPYGEKRLHVEIIGSTPIEVQRARYEVRSFIESISVKQLCLPRNGRYSVV